MPSTGKIARKVLDFDPLDFWAGNELYRARTAMGSQKEAQGLLNTLEVKMRDAVQSYLELAVDYGNCGFMEEAVDVLSRLVEADREGSSSFPMLHYYLGFYLSSENISLRL